MDFTAFFVDFLAKSSHFSLWSGGKGNKILGFLRLQIFYCFLLDRKKNRTNHDLYSQLRANLLFASWRNWHPLSHATESNQNGALPSSLR